MRIVYLSALVGVIAGSVAALFLHSLNLVTSFRLEHSWVLCFLPFAGWLIGELYHRWGQPIERGNALIFKEIHSPKKTIPFAMAPLIYLTTLLTHLCGGSAGREGTAVQMSASVSDQLSRFFKLGDIERSSLLKAAVGAGFGAAVGAPIAGAIFGLEVIWEGRIRFKGIIECAIASTVAFWVGVLLKTPHSTFGSYQGPLLESEYLFISLFAGVAFGFTARIFVEATHRVQRLFRRLISYPPYRPLLGGFLILGGYYFEGSLRFAGLGLEEISRSIEGNVLIDLPILKLIFTAFTLGSGFKGGEFIPLVFIGSSLGSALSYYFQRGIGLLAPLGFASIFAAAAKAPLACALMASELFGWKITIYALISVYAAAFSAGKHKIYHFSK